MRRSTLHAPLALLALVVGCRAALPPAAAPLARTPDAPFRSTAPTQPAAPLPELRIVTSSRADGLQVWAVPRPHAPVAVFGFSSPRAGLLRGHPTGAGELATLAQLARLQRSVPVAKVKGRTGLADLRITLTVPAASADAAAPHFAAVLSSAPDDRSLRAAKRNLRDGLQKEGFGSRRLARRLALEGLLGPEHPLALNPRDLAGRARRVQRGDLADFWTGRAARGPRHVVVVGPNAEALAKRVLQELPKAPPPGPLPAPAALRETQDELRIRVVRRNIAPWIEMTFPILEARRSHAEATLAAHLLGGSISGRLGDKLRLDSGHSYALAARYTPRGEFGLLRVRGNVGADDVPFFVETAQQIVDSLRTAPVSAPELAAARARWRGRLARDLSTARGTAHRLLSEGLRSPEAPDFEAQAAALGRVDGAALAAWAEARLQSVRGQVAIFAREQAIVPLSLLGDAEQVRLKPF